jgi:hypothetical protein
MLDFETRMPPASPVWPLSPRFVAILMALTSVALAASLMSGSFD